MHTIPCARVCDYLALSYERSSFCYRPLYNEVENAPIAHPETTFDDDYPNGGNATGGGDGLLDMYTDVNGYDSQHATDTATDGVDSSANTARPNNLHDYIQVTFIAPHPPLMLNVCGSISSFPPRVHPNKTELM